MPKITELLFDCDNTLVLSESLAFEACAELGNELLASKNVEKRYTGPELMSTFVGMNFRGVIGGMEKAHNFTISDEEREQYVVAEEDRVIATLKAKGTPCEGANEALERISKTGKYHMAVVSSSALRRVVASVEKVDQAKYFEKGMIFSAASSLPKPTSKPDPAVYLFAMEKIGVKSENCIAVEDSKSGTLAAVRAGIYTIAYTGSFEDPSKAKEVGQMLVDNGAKVIMEHWDQFDEILEKIQKE